MLAVPLLVVITRGHEYPVAGVGGVDRGLDGAELSGDVPETPHPQDAVLCLARRLAAILLLSEPWRAARWSLPPVSGLRAPLGEDCGEEGNQGEVGALASPVTATRGEARGRAHRQGLLSLKHRASGPPTTPRGPEGIGRRGPSGERVERQAAPSASPEASRVRRVSIRLPRLYDTGDWTVKESLTATKRCT